MSEPSQLLDRVRRAVRLRSLSRKTENAYTNHIRRFLEFTQKSDFARIEIGDISAFFDYLERDEKFSVSTQNQALYALTFLYRDVFGRSFPFSAVNAKRARRGTTPVVLTAEESKRVLANLSGAAYLAAALMYGSGLKLSETLNVRVGDINVESGEITVRDLFTGAKERTTILPKTIVPTLEKHLAEVRFTHEDDCLLGYGKVWLPLVVQRKHRNAAGEWDWQYVFPSCKLTATDDGVLRRHHLAESTVQKAVGEAATRARLVKKVCCQTFRYSFAARLFEKHTNVRTIQNMLGHKNLKTTMSYINFFGIGGDFVQSPLDY